jgi:RNA polymerase sigma-70 factor (ECF subfamily)
LAGFSIANQRKRNASLVARNTSDATDRIIRVVEPAVAVAMVDGPQLALALIDALAGDLDGYHLLHAARADLLRRIGSSAEAAKSYGRALALVTNESERRFLKRRLPEVQQS